MHKVLLGIVMLLTGTLAASSSQAAVDSYRFAHVTIATPWYIFIFLLMGVFVPFILMAVLSWRVAMNKSTSEASGADHNPLVK